MSILNDRRLQNWGGIPHPKGMVVEAIPEWLNNYCKKISQLGVFDVNQANHVLINEYLPNQGIMPHVDGPLYYPTVTTISLGSHTLLDFYKPIEDASDNNSNMTTSLTETASASYINRYLFSLLVEPRSLLILQDDMYKKYLHGIRELNEDNIKDCKNLILNLNNISEENKKFYEVNDYRLKRETRVSLTIRHVPKTLKVNVMGLLSKKK